ncbi:MAG: nicotinate-nucleotide adenylyltransferase [Ectothiorhodospiraceae bacterium AqS1]|nr:nicotinate-nucleotide adenylyltransferase [Ectothiorhodospiraceae bacterium AqS1]
MLPPSSPPPSERIGILGGTFDPIHCGHLRLALEMRLALGLDSVRLMPAPRPRLRPAPQADAATRMRLLEAAVAGIPGLIADGCELDRQGPTTTIETLRFMRAQYPSASLCLILGMDAFSRLDTWIEHEEIIHLAHIAVAHRADKALAREEAPGLLRKHRSEDARGLRTHRAGFVLVRDIPVLDISSSGIRERCARGESIRFLVPDRVHDILVKEGLYAATP